MSYGILYMIKNKVNNKVYIGQTVHSFKKRYPKGIEFTHNEHLKSAIKEYGIEQFEIFENIYKASTKEELDAAEKELIAKYKANNKKYGYNFLSGGHNGKHNEESRFKISIAQRGKLNHMYGKYGKDNPKYSRVESKCSCCGKTIHILRCNINRSNRHYCSVECARKDKKNCYKPRKSNKIELICPKCGCKFKKYPSQVTNKNYIYCSVECKNEHQKEILVGEKNPNYQNDKVKGGNNGRARKVKCITTGEIFDCARDAEKSYNISRGLVGACCRGEQKTCKGMKWEYI